MVTLFLSSSQLYLIDIVEIPKKVVLSEESYLKLLESYRLSEELKSSFLFKKKRKQRTIFTKQQTELLESVFNRNEYITLDERGSLAKQLKISEKQVKIWFQNRRNKLKKINSSLVNITDPEVVGSIAFVVSHYTFRKPNAASILKKTTTSKQFCRSPPLTIKPVSNSFRCLIY